MVTILTIQILFLDIPLYDKEKVESMPIANGELYKFDYNSNVELRLNSM